MNPIDPVERLRSLDVVENDILQCIQCAGQALQELSKDSKPSAKAADHNTTQFMKILNRVELEIGKNINYLTQVSTGHSHEGSSFATQKVVQMALHRSSHANARVMELDRMKTQMQAMTAMQHQQRPLPAMTTAQPQRPSSQPPGPGQNATNTPQTSAGGSTPVQTPQPES